ncbi:MAG: RIP metalloprotease RseP, partial [Betaproteobacteria bacterium]|nr:RIP metalloprotease RseP [Betaproteobacteria bacterium]
MTKPAAVLTSAKKTAVAVHEFGHFWVAKKLGIKVLRFSLGFGKVLKSWQLGETTYTICALPLGGFVKMLDENEGQVSESEKHRAFNRQNVYKRIAVVVAGPAANFILAVVLYSIVFMLGTPGIKAQIGMLENGGIADNSGLQIGDKLLSVNGKQTLSIAEFIGQFLPAANQENLSLKALSKTGELKTLKLNLSGDFLANPQQGVEKYLGFKFAFPTFKPIIDKVLPNKSAHLAGLKTGDEIIKANNNSVKTWRNFVAVIKQNPNQKVDLQIMRSGKLINLSLTPKIENGISKAGISLKVPENYLDGWRVETRKSPLDAFISANVKVYQFSVLNLIIIKKMLIGEASLKQISGPISIADYAGKTAETGFVAFLSFLALISIGLGLLNLLPIPLLDGGHLFFYLIEIIKGSQVRQSTQQIFMKFGILLTTGRFGFSSNRKSRL